MIPCAIVAAILGNNFGYWIGRRKGKSFVVIAGIVIAVHLRNRRATT